MKIRVKVFSIVIFLLIAFFAFYLPVSAQQNPDPEVYFAKAKNVKEMCQIRLMAIPDSADFYAIFKPEFAAKAWDLSKFNYCYSYKQLVKDTSNPEYENIKLVTTEVYSYLARNRYDMIFKKYDSSPSGFMLDSDLPIYEIRRGKTHVEYFAVEYVYVNQRWVCLWDLREIFIALIDKGNTFKNHICPNLN